jgi:hypothetical protein
MAGYLVKLARELVGADNKSQIPWDAPPHFRRLRATRGLLPPVHKSGMCGYLVFTPADDCDDEADGENNLLDELHAQRAKLKANARCDTPTDEEGELIEPPRKAKRKPKKY